MKDSRWSWTDPRTCRPTAVGDARIVKMSVRCQCSIPLIDRLNTLYSKRIDGNNKFVSLPVRTDVFKYSFIPRTITDWNSLHWLFVSCSRFSPYTGLCRTRHPPTVADYHDTPAVTGDLQSAPIAGHRTEEPKGLCCCHPNLRQTFCYTMHLLKITILTLFSWKWSRCVIISMHI